MKNSIVMRIIIPTIVIALSTSDIHLIAIPTSAEYKSLQNAKKTFTLQRQEINVKTYVSDFQKFVKETDSKIDTNKKKLSELKTLFELNHFENRNSFDQTSALEKYNDKLKAELDAYVSGGNGNWEVFKDSLLHNLNRLDLAYNEIKK